MCIRDSTYYGRPILKEPVWKWLIPAYFFTGGLAGASATFALVAQLTGRRPLVRPARLTALAGITASAVFLVADLGRPERFANMLRVARPTSPMSVGSWLLAVFGPAVGVAAMADVTGLATGAGHAAGLVAGTLGPLVATYTGVLVAGTSLPAWRGAGRELPALFGAGAAASAGGVALWCAPAGDVEPARRLALAGAAAELVAAHSMARSLGPTAEVYRTGRAGRLQRAATACAAAGAVALVAGRRRRGLALAGGALVTAGAALQRFAVVEAGHQSAAEPRYVLEQQGGDEGVGRRAAPRRV